MKGIITALVILAFIFFRAGAQDEKGPYLLVLGVAQDGGYPHIGCLRECCKMAWEDPDIRAYRVSLALVHPGNKEWWLFEATPDMNEQLHLFRELTNAEYDYLPAGIFVSHAHTGHYTGLALLGRESMNSKGVPVYCLPRMKTFLENNGPWSQLVSLGNINIYEMYPDSSLNLNPDLKVKAFQVPHREEFSETAGYRIIADGREYLFIPDVDKWSKWDRDIVQEVLCSDAAILDGTFFSPDELPGRRMDEVPHPFVPETMELFSEQPVSVKSRLIFIHFNHTNPLLRDPASRMEVEKNGFRVASHGMKIK